MRNYRTFRISKLRFGLTLFLLTNALSAIGQIACSEQTVVNGHVTHIYWIGNYELKQKRYSREYGCDGVGGYKFSFFPWEENGYPTAAITQYDDDAPRNTAFGKRIFYWPLPAQIDSTAIPDWVLQLINKNFDLFSKHLPNLQSVLTRQTQFTSDAPKTTGRGARGE